ncbi:MULTISPECIES: molecular chaperone TorD family protein [unclassified Photobacterium]|uniref:TorD/DmsD family molecular chaperone n=1 Tax=unclassified Photobacterium TaxID=2628852 RepID=UPI001EDFF56A|nr:MULTISPECIES: molecular chaperone TorD family protein [unclassified Photobacterium]MCG3863563.1 molecular chaperone TorD family protein [Photobacterium sp. Ph6]MCG3875092.1 molecular chaperone TorD family protein [Photobacterium sp. Ph5]
MHYESTLFRLLGGLLFYSPSSNNGSTILQAFAVQDDDLLKNIAALAHAVNSDELESDHFHLLQGSGDMPCPPWGSAYLDKENALFGSSTLQYREFTRQQGFACDTGMREPEDHIGLMLMLVSILLEQDNKAAANELFTQHLMPFAPFMLESMQQYAKTDFYQQLAAYTLAWLTIYCEEQQLEIVTRHNYWQEAQ